MFTENSAGRTMETGRLILEPLVPDHAVEMVPVLADHRLYEFIGGQAPTLEVLSRRYVLQSGRGQFGSGTGGQSGDRPGGETWLNWIIRVRDAECAAGFVQATVDPAGLAAQLAWVVGWNHQGRGYATEAALAMVGWLIRQGVPRFSAAIHPGNLASAAVAARLGLAPSGITDPDGEQLWLLS